MIFWRLGVAVAFLFAFAGSQCAVGAEASERVIEVAPDTFSDALADAKPGDTLSLADGVYKGGFAMTASGAPEGRISIVAAGGDAVIDASGHDCGLWLNAASHVSIEGVTVRNAATDGLQVEDAENVDIRNCIFEGNTGRGVLLTRVKHIVVEGCDVSGAQSSSGLAVITLCSDIVIRGNRVHDNGGGGIMIAGDLDNREAGGMIVGVLVERNRVWGNGINGGSAICFDAVSDGVIRNNLLYQNHRMGLACYMTHNAIDRAAGGESVPVATGNQVYNNVVYFSPGEGSHAVRLQNRALGLRFKNNILIGSGYGVISAEEETLAESEFDYNLIANHRGNVLIGDSSEGSPDQVGDWLKRGFGAHSVFAVMPEFVDASGGDFRLKPGSVCIDAGIDLGDLVKTDIDGTPRPQGKAYDCGCYEMKPPETK